MPEDAEHDRLECNLPGVRGTLRATAMLLCTSVRWSVLRPVDDSNLVIRALKCDPQSQVGIGGVGCTRFRCRLFREKSGVQRFFGVKLEKEIPAQAPEKEWHSKI